MSFAPHEIGTLIVVVLKAVWHLVYLRDHPLTPCAEKPAKQKTYRKTSTVLCGDAE